MAMKIQSKQDKRYTLIEIGSRHVGDVPVTRVDARDKYTRGLPYKVERRLVRSFTAFLQWYLQSYPTLKFESSKNIAKHLVYMPAGMRAWREYMPGGFATYHVHSPHLKDMQNGKRLDVITRAFFRHTHDAVNVRTRAYIMDWIATEALGRIEGEKRWLSLAGGSGQPVYDVFNELGDEDRQESRLVIADNNPDVLEFANQIYRSANLPIKNVQFKNVDVSDLRAVESLMTTEMPHVVDAMGLFEYLDDRASVELLRTVYATMPVGGVMIFTNMWIKRPQLDVHKRALGWPGVIPRSIRSVVGLMSEAGIPRQCQAVYHDDDGVYCVYRVMKNE